PARPAPNPGPPTDLPREFLPLHLPPGTDPVVATADRETSEALGDRPARGDRHRRGARLRAGRAHRRCTRGREAVSLTVAVLGTGSIGSRHLVVAQRVPGVTVVAVPARRSRVQELRGAGYTAAADLDEA